MEHTKHIWRAVLLLIAAGTVSVVGRHFMIPASFGDKGFYRYDSLADYQSLPVIHGDMGSCVPCHQPKADAKKAGKHASLSCEGCHGPLANHVKDNAKVADAPIDKTMHLCTNCHEKLLARPKDFPQIEVNEHLQKQGAVSAGEPIPEDICFTCHDPHNPAG